MNFVWKEGFNDWQSGGEGWCGQLNSGRMLMELPAQRYLCLESCRNFFGVSIYRILYFIIQYPSLASLIIVPENPRCEFNKNYIY